MAGERTVKIKFDGEQSGLAKAATGVNQSVNKVTKNVDRLSGSMGTATKAANKHADANDRVRTGFANTASAAGLAAIGIGAAALAWVNATGKALAEVERLNAQTTTVIRSMGAVWTDTDHIANYATQLEKLSGVEAEQVQAGQNLLLTYGSIQNRMGQGNDVFDQATSLMLDLSVATGKDMPGAATLLGKALNDPIKGVSALQKVGVQLTEQQRAQIKAFVESGDVMSAQKVILAELTRQFGGSAKAFGQTTAGQVLKLQNKFGDLSEELLVNLLPTINSVVGVLSDVVGWMQENGDVVKTVAIAVTGLAATYAAVKVSLMVVNGLTTAWTFISKLATTGTIGLGTAFAGMSVAARVASLSMGAIGIIATVVATALSLFSGSSASAQARQDALAEAGRNVANAIQEQNGAINKNVREVAAAELENQGLLKVASDMGIPLSLVTDAMLGQSGAAEELERRMEAYRIAATNAGVGTAITNTNINTLKNGVKDLAGSTESATAAEKRKQSAMESGTGAIEAQITALDELIDKQKEATDGVVDERRARSDLQEAYAEADKAFEENGRNIDLNSEAGRANQEVLNGMRDKTFALMESMAANGATADQLRGSMENARAKFVQVAAQLGYTDQQAAELATQLGLIPGDYNINVNANTGTAIGRVQAIINKLNDLRAAMIILQQASVIAPGAGLAGLAVAIGASGGRATGGPVMAGQAYVVGERGPEIFRPPNSGHIVPNHQVGGGDTLVNVYIDGEQFRGVVRSEIKEDGRATRRLATSGVGRSR